MYCAHTVKHQLNLFLPLTRDISTLIEIVFCLSIFEISKNDYIQKLNFNFMILSNFLNHEIKL